MSKYVKNLVTDHIRQVLGGVEEAILVNVVGLDANANNVLRGELAERGISLYVVKNSLAARATEGSSLEPMFDGIEGCAAICWGCEDIVSLAKEITALTSDDRFEAFEARGGILDGEWMDAAQVTEVSKWPTRIEQISILSGQIIGVGERLSAQISGPGGTLAGQIKQKAEDGQDEDDQDDES